MRDRAAGLSFPATSPLSLQEAEIRPAWFAQRWQEGTETDSRVARQTRLIVARSEELPPMIFAIRPFEAGDLPALYRICLLTGDAGGDATPLYRDPDLMGHYYAAPYAVLEPELCFLLTADGEPCGYVLGTGDTAAFNERAERDWFPALRARLPHPEENDTSADAGMLRLIHAGYSIHPDVRDYPAHLHIDLLPSAQRKGLGRKLIACYLAALRARGVSAVHLGVGERNVGAIAFYEKVGFHLIGAYPGWRAYGMRWGGAAE